MHAQLDGRMLPTVHATLLVQPARAFAPFAPCPLYTLAMRRDHTRCDRQDFPILTARQMSRNTLYINPLQS